MNKYEEGKKVRRIAAVIYVLIMIIIVGMTYFSQQDSEQKRDVFEDLPRLSK